MSEKDTKKAEKDKEKAAKKAEKEEAKRKKVPPSPPCRSSHSLATPAPCGVRCVRTRCVWVNTPPSLPLAFSVQAEEKAAKAAEKAAKVADKKKKRKSVTGDHGVVRTPSRTTNIFIFGGGLGGVTVWPG